MSPLEVACKNQPLKSSSLNSKPTDTQPMSAILSGVLAIRP